MNNDTTYNNQPINQQTIEEDEIDLRELFATIGRYKWSIILITLLITVIVAVVSYRMPKYYKTTTTIEIKDKGDKGGFSLGELGGAAALLGIPSGGGSSNAEKDVALLKTFRVNSNVLKGSIYTARYFKNINFRYSELQENNSSIAISQIKIPDYKKQGIAIKIEPIDNDRFKLYTISILSDDLLGEYRYNKPIDAKILSMTVTRNSFGVMPDKIVLAPDPHFRFEKIVSKNLTADLDKENPFLTISYLDTIPERGEEYLKKLLESHIKLSIGFEIEDANIELNMIAKQIEEVEQRVKSSSKKFASFKSSKDIVAPEAQAKVLLEGQAKIEEQLIQNRYQLNLIKQLISFVKKNRNIDAIAPSLVDLGDQPTTMLIAKLQELQLEATSLSQEFKSAYPKLKSIRGQIKSVKSKIRSNLKNLQKTLLSKQKALKKLEDEYRGKLKKVPNIEIDMVDLKRDYEINQKLYAYLLQKRSSVELKKAEAMNRFRIIEPIYTNPEPAKPKKSLIVVVGFITALILSIFLAFFREFLRRSKQE